MDTVCLHWQARGSPEICSEMFCQCDSKALVKLSLCPSDSQGLGQIIMVVRSAKACV